MTALRMRSRSHCIKNFEIAAGLREGEFKGAVFQDTDLAKWLEAVAYSLAYEPDAELEKRADAMIDLIGKAQQPDGYLDTYFIIKEPDKKFCNLREGHELYTAGHFMEAAVAYYQVTGKEKFLHIMQRVADLICEVFHQEAFQQAVPGHEEVEIGLIRLYQVTGERRYLEMAKDFVDRRGTEPNYLIHESERRAGSISLRMSIRFSRSIPSAISRCVCRIRQKAMRCARCIFTARWRISRMNIRMRDCFMPAKNSMTTS